MNYTEAIEFIHSIPKFVRPLGNANLGALLNLIGNPHKDLKFIHVAGTNGKGSVCAMSAEVFKCAGYKTGLFTSPFIEVFNERIRINGVLISDNELSEYVSCLAQIMQENNLPVSEFAFITAVAVKYFADKKCDIVVLETGMGGRLDATNIIDVPECAVLTSISKDHTQYLGQTLEEIALEKCGIIKRGGVVVSYINKATENIIKAEVEKNRAQLTVPEKAEKTASGFIYKGNEYYLSLKGNYQAENAAAVVEIVENMRKKGWDISETALRDGFKNVSWQARYEFIRENVVIDGGHNIDGIRALKENLQSEKRAVVLVLAMMKDKDYEECIKNIIQVAETVVATEVNMPRSLKAEETEKICLESGVECLCRKNINEAVKTALDIAVDSLVCVCGSLYLAGEVRKILK